MERRHRPDQQSEFARRHPIVLMIYVTGILLITMITRHPLLLTLSFSISVVCGVFLMGMRNLRRLFFLALPVLAFTTLILPLFHHNGVTPLFYVNGLAVTREAVVFGLATSEMLLAVTQWCLVAGCLIDSEKLFYLTGRLAPSAGLTLVMVFRLIPRMREQFGQIQDGQKGLGRDMRNMPPGRKIRQLFREISVLISWTLENSVVTSTSMESRGYGIGRRSCFHLYRFTLEDGIWSCVLVLVYAGVMACCMAGAFQSFYFPKLYWETPGSFVWISLVALAVTLLAPVFCEWRSR